MRHASIGGERRVLPVNFAVLLALVLCCVSGKSIASENNTSIVLFEQGNHYYEKGEYDKAINEYDKILAGGEESGPVYYNLGNAYFKNGKLGMAILNYEKAKLLMPRDADLDANYRFALARVKAKVVSVKSIWKWRPLMTYSGIFTINELTLVSAGMFLTILAVLALSMLLPRFRGQLVSCAFVLALLIILNVSVIWHKTDEINRTAVTIVPEADAFFGPFDSATKFFTLPEGMTVSVLKTTDDWYKVKRADDKIGWVKRSDVEKIR